MYISTYIYIAKYTVSVWGITVTNAGKNVCPYRFCSLFYPKCLKELLTKYLGIVSVS